MSRQRLDHFTCDRCGATAEAPGYTDEAYGPVSPPKDWTRLSQVPTPKGLIEWEICEACTGSFADWLRKSR